MRLWGYTASSNSPSRFTLDTLAKFAGSADFDNFCNEHGVKPPDGLPPSVTVAERCLSVDDALEKGDCVVLKWEPARVCKVRYDGHLRFTVIEAVNTHLAPGDSFGCNLIVEQQPLYLDKLTHPDGTLAGTYLCGNNGGVTFEIIRANN